MPLVQKVRRAAIYSATRAFVAFCNVVPRRLALFVGSVLGICTWTVLRRDQHKVHRHLALAFRGSLDHKNRENIGRQLYINFGRNITDLVRMPKHFVRDYSDLIDAEGLEYFDQAYLIGRGVFGVTGHIGNFELLAAFLAAQRYDIAVIGRKLYDPRLDRLLVQNRSALGLTNFRTTDSPRKLMNWLKDGKAIGVLIDIDSRRVRGQFVPVFGRWAYTPVGQSIIGLRVGASFVPMACIRTGDDRYRVIIRPPVQIEPSGDFEHDVYRITKICSEELEKIVVAHPDQWIWMHNRWRTNVAVTS
jgi:KDO2-lipid IV(A) lauroyltransferase